MSTPPCALHAIARCTLGGGTHRVHVTGTACNQFSKPKLHDSPGSTGLGNTSAARAHSPCALHLLRIVWVFTPNSYGSFAVPAFVYRSVQASMIIIILIIIVLRRGGAILCYVFL